jgi:hypothetical protein
VTSTRETRVPDLRQVDVRTGRQQRQFMLP